MEIYLDKRAVKAIRISAADAIEEGDTETLREDMMEAFSEEQIEEIERHIESGDFYDFLSEIVDEWTIEDVDELFELLEAQLSDAGIDLKFRGTRLDDDDDDDDDLEDDDEDDDDDDDDDSDDDEVDDDFESTEANDDDDV